MHLYRRNRSWVQFSAESRQILAPSALYTMFQIIKQNKITKAYKLCCTLGKTDHMNKTKFFFKDEIGIRLNFLRSHFKLQLQAHSAHLFWTIERKKLQKLANCHHSGETDHINKIKCFFKEETGIRFNFPRIHFKLQLQWHSAHCLEPLKEKNIKSSKLRPNSCKTLTDHINKIKCFFKEETGTRFNFPRSHFKVQLLGKSAQCFGPLKEKNYKTL